MLSLLIRQWPVVVLSDHDMNTAEYTAGVLLTPSMEINYKITLAVTLTCRCYTFKGRTRRSAQYTQLAMSSLYSGQTISWKRVARICVASSRAPKHACV